MKRLKFKRLLVLTSIVVISLTLVSLFYTSQALGQNLSQNFQLFRRPSKSEISVQINLPLILAADQPIEFIVHQGKLLSYQGAATCIHCHEQETHDFAMSNHYLWKGKLGVINDFCSYPDINLGPGKLTTVTGDPVDGGCTICHAGLGEFPSPNNPENADCLVCHAEDYRRTATALGGEIWRFRPDFNNMPPTITIQKEPTRRACLICHANAGGGENNKRGDISTVLITPTENQDVHMSHGMTCVDCHRTNDTHQIAGRGVDLRIDEGVEMVACESCHDPLAEHNEKLRSHLPAVACQSCHIPTFGRAVSTDMLRDFQDVEVNPKGLYEPVITRQSNVSPIYAFWNGKSSYYNFGDAAFEGQPLAWPLGNIDDGQLYPFKRHQAAQPQNPVTGAILPVKAGILFQTGNMDLAIRTGAQQSGISLTQGYIFVDTTRWMGIFHEMPPADFALGCDDCHDGSNRINFQALGYTPKITREGKPLCTSCHGQSESKPFYDLHDKHVGDGDVACEECHQFTR